MTTPNETPEQRREDLPEILRQKFYRSNMDAVAFMAVCYRMGEDACRKEMFTEEQVRVAMDLAVENRLKELDPEGYGWITDDEIIKQIKPPTP